MGALLRARTKDANGNELGTFTADTRPTAAEVQELISQAMGDVGMEARPCDDAPTEVLSAGTSLVALKTAMLIETSYFPEQTNNDRKSSFDALEKMYDSGLPKFVEAVAEACGGDNTAGESGSSARASAAFPAPFPYGEVAW